MGLTLILELTLTLTLGFLYPPYLHKAHVGQQSKTVQPPTHRDRDTEPSASFNSYYKNLLILKRKKQW